MRLAPHPEGGWYRRTYTSDVVVSTDRGDRPMATSIVYLLEHGHESRWHRVHSDELWLWHGPGSLTLDVGDEHYALDAAEPQRLVPAGVWQRASADGDTLVSCVVAPGFDFADFEMD